MFRCAADCATMLRYASLCCILLCYAVSCYAHLCCADLQSYRWYGWAMQYRKRHPRAAIEKIIAARGCLFPIDSGNVVIQCAALISFAVGSTSRECRTPLGIEKIMPLGGSASCLPRGCVRLGLWRPSLIWASLPGCHF